MILCSLPAVTATDVGVHVGVDESSEACAGEREEHSSEGSWGNGEDAGEWTYGYADYDEACTWHERDVDLAVSLDDAEVVSVDVGRVSTGTREGSSWWSDQRQTLCGGSPCDVQTSSSSGNERRNWTSREGVHARLAGERADVDVAECRGADEWYASAYDDWSSAYSQAASSCDGGLFIEALGASHEERLYSCESVGQSGTYNDDRWSSTTRWCSLVLSRGAHLDGTGTFADGTGVVLTPRYETTESEQCSGSADAPECSGSGYALVYWTIVLSIGPHWTHEVGGVEALPFVTPLP